MKVIFLDIDGVLNDAATTERSPGGWVGIDDDKVALLRQIVESSGAEIVLTSTWKNDWSTPPDQCTPDGRYMQEKLAKHGLSIIDKTKDNNAWRRGSGIRRWLQEHQPVEAWLVLDDQCFQDFKEEGIVPHFVQTDSLTGGLTEQYISSCLHILFNSIAGKE